MPPLKFSIRSSSPVLFCTCRASYYNLQRSFNILYGAGFTPLVSGWIAVWILPIPCARCAAGSSRSTSYLLYRSFHHLAFSLHPHTTTASGAHFHLLRWFWFSFLGVRFSILYYKFLVLVSTYLPFPSPVLFKTLPLPCLYLRFGFARLRLVITFVFVFIVVLSAYWFTSSWVIVVRLRLISFSFSLLWHVPCVRSAMPPFPTYLYAFTCCTHHPDFPFHFRFRYARVPPICAFSLLPACCSSVVSPAV